MNIFQAIILGIIQGLTEFLPVSSSAHLLFIPKILNWNNIPDSYEVALHFGTIMAICVIFFKDWVNLIISGMKVIFTKNKETLTNNTKQEGKIFWYIFFSSLIVGVIGKIIDDYRDSLKSTKIIIYIMAFALIIMGILLYIIDKKKSEKIDLKNMNLKQGILIGISQILALIPGMSRSGTTITCARLLNVNRKDAAKYSFYLSTPIIFMATILKLKEFEFNLPFILGTFTSFLTGMLVLKVFLKYLEKKDFKIFAIYRVIIGLILLGFALI